MSSREGFDSYQLYLGVKLHFNSESYDFIKYNGKVKADLPSFLKRNDRFQCSFNGADEAMTHTQHTLTSSDTGPYAQGFRKSFHSSDSITLDP